MLIFPMLIVSRKYKNGTEKEIKGTKVSPDITHCKVSKRICFNVFIIKHKSTRDALLKVQCLLSKSYYHIIMKHLYRK